MEILSNKLQRGVSAGGHLVEIEIVKISPQHRFRMYKQNVNI